MFLVVMVVGLVGLAMIALPALDRHSSVAHGMHALRAGHVAKLAPRLAKISKHDEVAAEMPGVYAFKPKRSARRLLTLAMLAGLAASAYFVSIAVETRTSAAIGLAAIVALATVMIWAIRAGASVTKLTGEAAAVLLAITSRATGGAKA